MDILYKTVRSISAGNPIQCVLHCSAHTAATRKPHTHLQTSQSIERHKSAGPSIGACASSLTVVANQACGPSHVYICKERHVRTGHTLKLVSTNPSHLGLAAPFGMDAQPHFKPSTSLLKASRLPSHFQSSLCTVPDTRIAYLSVNCTLARAGREQIWPRGSCDDMHRHVVLPRVLDMSPPQQGAVLLVLLLATRNK